MQSELATPVIAVQSLPPTFSTGQNPAPIEGHPPQCVAEFVISKHAISKPLPSDFATGHTVNPVGHEDPEGITIFDVLCIEAGAGFFGFEGVSKWI